MYESCLQTPNLCHQLMLKDRQPLNCTKFARQTISRIWSSCCGCHLCPPFVWMIVPQVPKPRVWCFQSQCWINQSIISAVHATAGRWPPQLGCGVEPRNPPRWFRAAWWARQLSLRVDSLAMRQVVWGYILPIAGPKQNLWPDLTFNAE